MLKKWMLALGLTSVLTLAACGGGEDEGDTENGDQQKNKILVKTVTWKTIQALKGLTLKAKNNLGSY